MTPKKNIVIVDDDTGLLESVSALFDEEGITTYPFATGHDFLEKIDVLHPDIILLDIRLPDTTGDCLARKLRSIPKYAHTPIVFISANDNLANLADHTLADDYVSKPFDFDLLLNVIGRHLSLAGL